MIKFVNKIQQGIEESKMKKKKKINRFEIKRQTPHSKKIILAYTQTNTNKKNKAKQSKIQQAYKRNSSEMIFMIVCKLRINISTYTHIFRSQT